MGRHQGVQGAVRMEHATIVGTGVESLALGCIRDVQCVQVEHSGAQAPRALVSFT